MAESMHLRGWWTIPVLACLAMGAAAGDISVIAAVKSGDTAAVRALLQRHADVNAVEADGATALHWAVRRDDLPLVDLLIRSGARANAATRYGVTPLSLAAENGSARVVERLLKAGANVKSVLPGGETVLMTAARAGSADAVTLLLAHGADVNAREATRGQTALMWAAARDNAAAVEALVKAGADVHVRSHGPGATPLRGGRLDSFTPLIFAVRAGAINATRALLRAGANVNDAVEDGTSALVIATMNAHWELAAFLLDAGANPDAAEQGWTALHQIARTRALSEGRLPHPVPTGALDSLDLVKRLIAHGANVNARMTKPFKADNERTRFAQVGVTPFLLAAKGVDAGLLRLLAAHGADTFVKTSTNTPALMLAAGVQVFLLTEDSGTNADALDAVKVLLDLGADVNAVDNAGDTALHGAAFRGSNEIVQLLVDRGAKLDVQNKVGWTPLANAHLVYTSGMSLQSWPDTEALLRKLMEARGLPTEVRTIDDIRKTFNPDAR